MAAHPARRGACRVGYFGASTGAAAGAVGRRRAEAPASRPSCPAAGGPTSPAAARPASRAPTLLIVGGDDDVVLDLNRTAQAGLRCENRLAVVPGATHLFEEPGTLDAVARLAGDWFTTHLTPPQCRTEAARPGGA